MLFFRMFQHVLPRAKAWSMIIDKQLRQFFLGLTGIGEDIKEFLDLLFVDKTDAQETRQLPEWESELNLPSTGLTEQQRRDRLEETWKSLGEQSPRYIQDTLQASGFDVYIHEWWWPGVAPGSPVPPEIIVSGAGYSYMNGTYKARPTIIIGGMVSYYNSSVAPFPPPPTIQFDGVSDWQIGTNLIGFTAQYWVTDPGLIPPKTGWGGSGTPPPPTLAYEYPFTVRPPLDYLRRSMNFINQFGAGDPTMEAGEVDAEAGDGITLLGYALVNKVYRSETDWLSLAGEAFMEAGEVQATAGDYLTFSESLIDYVIPADPNRWPYFLYIGGEVFGDLASVPTQRKNEFETLCLKICPTQQWLGILVNYS